MSARHDVVVVGSGPAGWAAAAACGEAGLDTLLISDNPFAAWPATYGMWIDEVDSLGYADCFSNIWSSVAVVGRIHRTVHRAYGRVDNSALAERLRQRATRAGLSLAVGTAVGATHYRDRSTVLVRGGQSATARLVIDASGASGVLAHQVGRITAWQSAFGYIATLSRPPSTAECVLMDYSGQAVKDRAPSFLYAQDLGSGCWFVQETVLASRQIVPVETLQEALDQRLTAMSISVRDRGAAEYVAIPMGAGIPKAQRVVAIGAAGGGVHPATGYSLAGSLVAAPKLATAIAEAFARRTSPEAVSDAAWSALWPDSVRSGRRLQEYGLHAMLRMKQSDLQTFFDAFFALEPADRDGYLSSSATRDDVVRTMRRLWASAPPAVRRQLFGADARMLLRR